MSPLDFTPRPYSSSFQAPKLASVPLATPGGAASSPSTVETWTPPQLAKRPRHLSLGQGDSPAGSVRPPFAPYYLTAALILGGISIGIATYYHRDTMAGGIAFGTATSLAGTGVLLLLIDLLRT